MNWNGKVDAESPSVRIVQFLTSWRIYGGMALFIAALVLPPALGYPETYYVGFFAGAIGYIAADNLISTAVGEE